MKALDGTARTDHGVEALEERGRWNPSLIGGELVVHCQSGQRSYFACRILSQLGFRVRNLTGSYRTWKTATATPPSPS